MNFSVGIIRINEYLLSAVVCLRTYLIMRGDDPCMSEYMTCYLWFSPDGMVSMGLQGFIFPLGCNSVWVKKWPASENSFKKCCRQNAAGH